MNAPSFSAFSDLDEYLHEMADFLATVCVPASGAFSARRLLLARVIPGMTQEKWAALAARHGLTDWHVLPLPDAPDGPARRAAPIMVRADEKKFLYTFHP